jgi:excisionase family DNA binding protein
MGTSDDRLQALERLREELVRGGRSEELAALDQVLNAERMSAMQSAPQMSATGGAMPAAAGAPRAGGAGGKQKTYLKLKKKYYTPAEVAKRVGVSRQTIVKWIERGELEAEMTPGGHHRIPASVFYREGRGEPVQLIPVEEE